MVSIPFHQIVRSTCPVFTVLIYRLGYNRSYSTRTYLSLIPVIVGVGLTTYGDYYFTHMGFVLTLAGMILAAIKVPSKSCPPLRRDFHSLTNPIQTRL
jgi:drug/metabolite transporter (DMT)-like permease